MPNPPLHSRFSSQSNWLAFRLGHLGDVVLATGVLAHLAEQHTLRFHVITATPWLPVFTEHPFVERVIPFDKGTLSFTEELKTFRSLAKEYAGWGLLDLHGILRSRLLAALWQGPIARYPKMSMERRLLLTCRHDSLRRQLCALRVPQRYALALEQTPSPASTLLPHIWLTPEETDAGSTLLSSLFAEKQPVALHPFATHTLKSWPRPLWISLAKQLEKQGIPFIVIGKGDPLFPDSKTDFTNKTTLRETCALLSQCRTLVTGDSGPMHLATAVSTPVIALFGPTGEEWGFYPSGPNDIIIESSLPCRPCSLHGQAQCPYNSKCMQNITPDMIVQALGRQERQRYAASSAVQERRG